MGLCAIFAWERERPRDLKMWVIWQREISASCIVEKEEEAACAENARDNNRAYTDLHSYVAIDHPQQAGCDIHISMADDGTFGD